jgi:hypothetical protein
MIKRVVKWMLHHWYDETRFLKAGCPEGNMLPNVEILHLNVDLFIDILYSV